MTDKKSQNSKTTYVIVGGVVLSLALVAALVWNLEWRVFFEHLRNVRVPLLAVVALCMPLSFFVRAYRWRYFIPGGESLAVRSLFDATVLGMLGNMVFPLRIGEAVRAWSINRSEGVPFSTGFATVIVERVFDILTLIAFLAITLSYSETVPETVILGAKALGVLAVLILTAMLVAYLWGEGVLKLYRAVATFVLRGKLHLIRTKLDPLVTDFVEGLRAIRSGKQLLVVLGLSVVLWGIHSVVYTIGLAAFHDVPSLWLGTAINAIVAFAVAAPSAPGFVGTFQVGCVIAIETLGGRTHDFAMAYSLVLHTVQFAAIIVLGIYILHSRGLRIGALKANVQVPPVLAP